MLKLAVKDLRLIIHDKRAVVLTLLVPVALISLFAFAFGGTGKSNDTNPIAIYISDQDSTDVSRDVVAQLDTMSSLDIKKLPFDEAKNEVNKGSRVAVLAIYKGFKDSVEAGSTPSAELFYDQSRQIEAGLLQQVLFSKLMGIIGKRTIKKSINKMIVENNPDLSKDELDLITSKVNEQMEGFEKDEKNPANNFMGIKATPIFAKSENNLGLVQAVAGTAIMMLLFTVTGMGSGMLLEKEEGTLKKLLYSPLQPTAILFGKMTATIVVSIIQLTVMFLFAWLVFGLDIFIDIPSLILMILSTAFACATFGIFIASIAKTRKQVESYSTLIILIMSAIGGSMVPLFIMPAIMQKIAIVSVNYWGIQGFYDIFWRHLAIGDVAIRATVLIGIGLFMMIISIRNFKKNILSIA
ncbi:MAG TPA: ABC transporter permease [Ignavibacteriaceae bacterium]|nr:ABC transporter permease [Ignavibacteriaceae bacterium]